MKHRKRPKPINHAEDFGLDPLGSEDDMFRWFLMAYMLGKPIQSTVAAKTWKVFIDNRLDTPWSILNASDNKLVSCLCQGGYSRYQHVMAMALRSCMEQLVRDYEGSIMYLLSLCQNEDELNKLIQKLYGVGPKTAEIFMRETEEYFARSIE